MNKIRIFAVFSIVTLGALFTATARADGDDWNKLTKVTLSEPVAVSARFCSPAAIGSGWSITRPLAISFKL